MKLGIAKALTHNTAKEWAEKHSALGLSAIVFPVNCNAEKQKIIDYKQAADDYGLTIAEVGAWRNLLDTPVLFAGSLLVLIVPVALFAIFQDKFMNISFGGGIKG